MHLKACAVFCHQPDFVPRQVQVLKFFRVYVGVKTCEIFLCFVAIVRVRYIMLTSLFCFTSLVSVPGFYTEDEPFFMY